ncbi:MAG: hypothetical protein AAB592_02920 [Patescibacteria group bacterium]
MLDTNFSLRHFRRDKPLKKEPLSEEVTRVIKYLAATLICIVLFASFFFLLSTSKTAQQGYELRQSQMLNRDLREQNRVLEEDVLRSQSSNAIEESEEVDDMVDAENPIYILPGTDRLTQKR